MPVPLSLHRSGPPANGRSSSPSLFVVHWFLSPFDPLSYPPPIFLSLPFVNLFSCCIAPPLLSSLSPLTILGIRSSPLSSSVSSLPLCSRSVGMIVTSTLLRSPSTTILPITIHPRHSKRSSSRNSGSSSGSSSRQSVVCSLRSSRRHVDRQSLPLSSVPSSSSSSPLSSPPESRPLLA